MLVAMLIIALRLWKLSALLFIIVLFVVIIHGPKPTTTEPAPSSVPAPPRTPAVKKLRLLTVAPSQGGSQEAQGHCARAYSIGGFKRFFNAPRVLAGVELLAFNQVADFGQLRQRAAQYTTCDALQRK